MIYETIGVIHPMFLGREMVLATVGLVIVEGVCDARQKTQRKGHGETNHCEVYEDSLWKYKHGRFQDDTTMYIYEPIASGLQAPNIL